MVYLIWNELWLILIILDSLLDRERNRNIISDLSSRHKYSNKIRDLISALNLLMSALGNNKIEQIYNEN